MAKKKGKKGKKGKKISFGPKGQVKLVKKPNKTQKFISKISKDGKISKKEGQKAAKKGISLSKIQNRNIGDYRQALRDFEDKDYRNPAAMRPTFKPLKIKGGAQSADFARMMSEYQKSAGGGGKKGGGKKGGGKKVGSPAPGPTNPYQAEIDKIIGGEPDQPVVGEPVSDPYADAIAALQQTIAGIQMPDYGAELDAMRAQQENYMKELAAQQAEFERQRELAFRTSQENTARGGMLPEFRIGASSPRNMFGTGAFKRKPTTTPAVIAGGISPITLPQTPLINNINGYDGMNYLFKS